MYIKSCYQIHWYNLHDFTEPNTIVCEDKEDWCSLTKPDCTLQYVKLNCKNYCGLCKNNVISYKFYFVTSDQKTKYIHD